jgi:hypothetical protein
VVGALDNLPRSGRPPEIDEIDVVVATIAGAPGRDEHWSARLLAGASSASNTSSRADRSRAIAWHLPPRSWSVPGEVARDGLFYVLSHAVEAPGRTPLLGWEATRPRAAREEHEQRLRNVGWPK